MRIHQPPRESRHFYRGIIHNYNAIEFATDEVSRNNMAQFPHLQLGIEVVPVPNDTLVAQIGSMLEENQPTEELAMDELDTEFDTNQFLESYDLQWDAGLAFAEQVDFFASVLQDIVSAESILPPSLMIKELSLGNYRVTVSASHG